MTNESKLELLSAYMDGEEVSESQINEILSDLELLAKWDSYHKISSGLKGELPQGVSTDFCDNVSALLEKEPVYIDISQKKTQVANDDNIVSKSEKQVNQVKRFSRVYKTLSQLALVASVAIICVFVSQVYYNGNGVNGEFNDVAAIGVSGVSITPVTNSSPNNIKSISLTENKLANVNNKAQTSRSLNAEQLKQLEKQRMREIQTLDALLEEHEQIKQAIIIDK